MTKENQLEKLGKARDSAFADIKKQHGAGAIMTLGQSDAVEKVEVISTGTAAIDNLTGIGGFPRGKIVEIYGVESSGKTTLALQVVAQAQKMGGRAAYIDIENAVDPIYSAALGVDIESLDFSQPDYGEQALEITLRLILSKVYAVIVVDSVAALVPLAEIEGDMGQAQMGLQARLMSQAMRKLNAAVANSGTCLIFINQVRQKIGVVFGNPETTTGGVALKFYSSLRISVHKSTVEKNSGGAFGQEVRIKIEKNKMAPPLKEAKVLLRFGQGFVSK